MDLPGIQQLRSDLELSTISSNELLEAMRSQRVFDGGPSCTIQVYSPHPRYGEYRQILIANEKRSDLSNTSKPIRANEELITFRNLEILLYIVQSPSEDYKMDVDDVEIVVPVGYEGLKDIVVDVVAPPTPRKPTNSNSFTNRKPKSAPTKQIKPTRFIPASQELSAQEWLDEKVRDRNGYHSWSEKKGLVGRDNIEMVEHWKFATDVYKEFHEKCVQGDVVTEAMICNSLGIGKTKLQSSRRAMSIIERFGPHDYPLATSAAMIREEKLQLGVVIFREIIRMGKCKRIMDLLLSAAKLPSDGEDEPLAKIGQSIQVR
ncbi:hypothetical protein C8J56DRAFT_1025962 [Mycena floridula]|nr:hypothetical protein C8J56DRAFT_1025962 [Mycena floridula]